MSKQPQKAYWNRPDAPEYQRHSVKRELLRFMGWDTLIEIIEEAENVKTSFEDGLFVADWIAVDFAEARSSGLRKLGRLSSVGAAVMRMASMKCSV